ncbi:hypothetical protein [Salipiger mucosus]|uniref:Phage protein n=1 Tax=Salipiger mucosus DSM 16094 TaxID=1123237 RepID=S9QV20_9RHOB|nr:hypothetical protein [Salipiger mucosus]EPX83463.1 hypothetical protein Salmuc_02071 [Salipiger mucosus DSM 16094]
MTKKTTSPDADLSSIEAVLSGDADISYRQGYVVLSTRRFQEILNERDRLLAEARAQIATAGAGECANNLDPIFHEVDDECRRQVEVEGWTAENDDRYFAGRLAAAGGTYALQAADTLMGRPAPEREIPRTWSMDPKAWKPKDARRDLIRALALGVAELKRMQRAETPAARKH